MLFPEISESEIAIKRNSVQEGLQRTKLQYSIVINGHTVSNCISVKEYPSGAVTHEGCKHLEDFNARSIFQIALAVPKVEDYIAKNFDAISSADSLVYVQGQEVSK